MKFGTDSYTDLLSKAFLGNRKVRGIRLGSPQEHFLPRTFSLQNPKERGKWRLRSGLQWMQARHML